MYFTASVAGNAALTNTVEAAVGFDENAGTFTVTPDLSVTRGTYWEITLTAYTCEPARAVDDTTPCPDGNNSDGDPYK